ncbi:MAG: cellulose synthase subunit BcsC, partial [Verrucomicrobia bacterium]|nr:cellulose synthase subunit BcsC [Verrucomicrobiota bacterium]
MSESNKPVFLSYASQDADAAKRICDALLAAGVEVWFDQSELRGGDAWDAKIRRQIKECALFVPLITANTNARPEGYFRLEWKLAVDRSHLLAEDHPFLFPIAIGDVVQETARVPDKFRDVQWTRMRLDETPAELAHRVARLLSGGVLDPIAAGTSVEPKARRLRKPAWLRYAWSLVALVLVAKFFIFKPRRNPEDLAKTLASAQSMVELASKSAAMNGGDKTDAGQLAEKAFALTQKLSFGPEDLVTAETLAQRATDLAPDSARAWGVRAWVQASYLMRNFDYSEHRIQETEAAARHALALDPDEVNALNALSQVYEKQGAPSEVEKLARRAIALDPKNFRARAHLGRALQDLGQIDEARMVLRQAVDIYPSNPLAHYDLAGSYVNSGFHRQLPTAQDVATALEQLDASIALQPFSSSLMCKAALVGGVYGDLASMRQQLDQLEKLSLVERASDRAVYVEMFGGLC